MTDRPQDRVAAARRLANRQTQEQLADRLTEETGEKWSREMVANLETGRRNFDVDTLMAIAKIHGRNYSWYLQDAEPADRAKGLSLNSILGGLTQPLPQLAQAS